jgi:hypothetical protein
MRGLTDIHMAVEVDFPKELNARLIAMHSTLIYR